MNRICPKCKKDSCEFSSSKNGTYCKLCMKEYRKLHYIQNKDYYSSKNKKYRIENKEKVKKLNRKYRECTDYYKQYRKENKISLNEKKKVYLRNRYKNDIAFKLKTNIYQRVSKSLKGKVSLTLKENLPYTTDELIKHLESQFESWMNWDNYGKYNSRTWDDHDSSTWTWHVDHIVPHSQLKYTSFNDENFKLCWSLDNLRPYPSKQNIKDGNRR